MGKKIIIGKQADISFANGLEIQGTTNINLPGEVLQLTTATEGLAGQVLELTDGTTDLGGDTKEIAEVTKDALTTTAEALMIVVENFRSQLAYAAEETNSAAQAADTATVNVLGEIGSAVLNLFTFNFGGLVTNINTIIGNGKTNITESSSSDEAKKYASDVLDQIKRICLKIAKLCESCKKYSEVEISIAEMIYDQEKSKEETEKIKAELQRIGDDIRASLVPVQEKPFDSFLSNNKINSWIENAKNGTFKVGNKNVTFTNGVLGKDFVQHQDVSKFQTAEQVGDIIDGKGFTTLPNVRETLGIASGTINDVIDKKGFITDSKFDDTYRSQVTPQIGTDGKWWINGISTGKASRGEDGATPEILQDGDNLTIKFGDVVKFTGNLKGAPGVNGVNGKDGINGKDGSDGKDGVGIAGVSIDDNGDLYVIKTNETIASKIGRVRGLDGKNGIDGKNGTDGKDGVTPTVEIDPRTFKWKINGELSDIIAKGQDGNDGRDGEDGAPGADGKDGAPGRDGVDGKDGLTPDILQNGDTLTIKYGDVTKFSANLKGLPGHTPTITINENNMWTIDGQATEIKAKGEDGYTPIKGTDYFDGVGISEITIDDAGDLYIKKTSDEAAAKIGKVRGVNGITPHIGTNGNWWIGTTDTEKPARGEKGEVDEQELKSAVSDEITSRDLVTETSLDAKGFSKLTLQDVDSQISNNDDIKGIRAKTDLFSIDDDTLTISKTLKLGNKIKIGESTLTASDIDTAKAAGTTAASALEKAENAKTITDKLDNGVVEKVKNAATLSSIRHNDIY